IGGFLRRTSLDELPQLFNVLKGEMSLVGPRPIITAELERYNEEVDYYLLSKPGMTGLWQVSGRSDVDYETRVYLDAWYVKNWSMWNDIAILFKTVGVVLKRDGAY
ncbi:TPA: sugar transferase, partial [Klebsiella pneumoniae]|nr:sugar transferase [Klebsiella pneumoniae]